ncbi:MAG: rod shape-determining protein RodA [Armatimonadota bacterium]
MLASVRRLDWTLVAAVGALCACGLLAVYSATRGAEAPGVVPPSPLVQKQALWMLIGGAAFVVAVAFDYEAIARWHVGIYAVVLALLVAVLVVGRAPTGAASWIAIGSFRLQPSELAKIAVLLSLAAFLARRRAEVSTARVVLASLLIPAAPLLLVALQPDLGTAFVIAAIWFAAVFLAGARVWHLAALFAAGVALFLLMWRLGDVPQQKLPRAVAKIASKAALKDYQKRRMTVFLNPQADPLGAGYHVIQSRVAIGSGRLLGRGLGGGTQGRLRFIPERHTDFVFSVIGEEFGFIGSAAVVGLFLLLFWRGLRIAMLAGDSLGALIAAGAVAMLVFHAIVSIGMSVNIMPITGLPLPFVSYGGSNLFASFIAFGLLQNVHMRRERITF